METGTWRGISLKPYINLYDVSITLKPVFLQCNVSPTDHSEKEVYDYCAKVSSRASVLSPEFCSGEDLLSSKFGTSM